jgi:hypothetical protein
MTRKQLLPPELLDSIPALYSTEKTPLRKKVIKVKYFLANFTWLVAECEVREDGDVLFFGYVKNHSDPDCSEWGYFTLSQLMEIKIFGVLGVERDLYFNECTFKEYMEKGTSA